MKSKVIIFCVLLFCSKFVVSVPFNEEQNRQRAYPPSNWQGNQNTAEQNHGSGFARTQNSMTNSAQKYESGQEYNANQGRQQYENHGLNSQPSSLSSLPSKENPANFASGTNDRRSEGYSPRGNAYPIKTGNHPILRNQQYRQQNWQSGNQFANTASSADNERHLTNVQNTQHSQNPLTNVASVVVTESNDASNGYQKRLINTQNSQFGQTSLSSIASVASAQGPEGSTGYQRRVTNVNTQQEPIPLANAASVANTGSIDGSGGYRRRVTSVQNPQYRPNPLSNVASSAIAQTSGGFRRNYINEQNQYQGQHPLGNIASSASAIAVGGQRGQQIIQDARHDQNHYHGPGHVVEFIPPSSHPIHPSNGRYPGAREHYNYPLLNKPPTSRYEEYSRPSSPNHAGLIPYENYNDGHVHAANINEQKASGNQPPYFPSSGNNDPAPNTFNSPIVPINVAPENTGYVENPVLNSGPSNQPEPNNYNPIIPIENPTYNKYDDGSVINFEPHLVPEGNYYGAPLVPVDNSPQPTNAYNESPLIPLDNGPPPSNVYNEPPLVPLDNSPPPTNTYNGPPLDITPENYNNPVDTYPAPESAPVGDNNNYKDIFDHYATASKGGNMDDFFENDKIKNILSAHKNRFVIIHPNGTVEYIDDIGPLTHKNPDVIKVVHNKPGDSPPVDNTAPAPPQNTDDTPNNAHSIPSYPDSGSDKTDKGQPPVAPPPSSSENSSPPEPLPPNSDGSNQPPNSPSPTANGNNPGPPGPGAPTHNYNPQSGPSYPNDNNYYQHNPTWDNSYATPPSHLHTHISPTGGYPNYPSPDNRQPQHLFNPNSNKTDFGSPPSPYVPSGNDYNPSFYPQLFNGNNQGPYNPQRDNNNGTPPPKIPTHISPGIFTSTTPTPDKEEIQKYIDSIPQRNNNSPAPYNPSGNDYKPSSNPAASSGDNTVPYNPTAGDDYVTPAPKLPTRISPGIFTSTTPSSEDALIAEFIEESLKPEDDDPLPITSESDNNPSGKGDSSSGPSGSSSDSSSSDSANSSSDSPSSANSSSSSNTSSNGATTSPVETSTDQIITISPIELATDNVKDGTSDNSTPAPSGPQKGNNNFEDIIKELLNKKNNTADNDNETKNSTDDGKNDSKSATNDSLTNTDAPATSDDNSTVETNTTNQSDVDTGDTSSGDNLLESEPPTNDLNITLSVPKDSHDGTLTISIEVPDSTGDGDTEGDETLVVSIDKKKGTDTDSSSADTTAIASDSSNGAKNDKGLDKIKNVMIDLLDTVTVWNKTTENEFFQQMTTDNSPVNVLYMFQVVPPSTKIIEKNKETTIYPNGTIDEIYTETIWESKDDPSPTVIKTEKTYHRDHKPQ